MILNITTLDSKLLSKIPLSIRLNLKNNLLDTDNLPLEIAYELRNYTDQESLYTYLDNKTVDLKPIFSIYSDFTSLISKKDAIIEYVKNYLILNKGDYPFDPTFGSSIKLYLQKLDIEPASLSIDQELSNLVDVLSNSFQIPIQISSANIKKIENANNVYFQLDVKLQVSDVMTSITFEKSMDSYYLM